MKVFRNIFSTVSDMTSGYQEGFLSMIGMGFFFKTSRGLNGMFSVADIIITWGMAFIVGYGVVRITLNLVWNIFFGRDFHWKLGILEKLFQRLKPMQIQTKIEKAVKDDEEKSLKRMKVIMKKRQKGGGVNMGFKKFMGKLNANKWTILGVTSIVGVSTLGAFGVINPTMAVNLLGNLNNLGAVENVSQSVVSTVVIVGAASVGVKSVLGAGPETVDQYKERKEIVKANKKKKKEAKLNGTNDIERVANKLMKIGMPKDDAYNLAKKGAAEKAKAHAAEIAEKENAEKAKKANKFAKKMSKMGLSQEDIAKLNK